MGLFALIQPWIDLIWGWMSILLLTELFLVLLFSLVQPFRYHSCEPEVPSPWWTPSSSFYFLNPVRLCSASLSLNHPFLFSLKLYEHLFWFFSPSFIEIQLISNHFVSSASHPIPPMNQQLPGGEKWPNLGLTSMPFLSLQDPAPNFCCCGNPSNGFKQVALFKNPDILVGFNGELVPRKLTVIARVKIQLIKHSLNIAELQCMKQK